MMELLDAMCVRETETERGQTDDRDRERDQLCFAHLGGMDILEATEDLIHKEFDVVAA